MAYPTKEPTRKAYILDIILANNVEIENNVKVIQGISAHDMVLFEVNFACRRKKPIKPKIYIRKRADATRRQKELRGLAYELAETGNSDTTIVEMWDHFGNNIHRTMDTRIPQREV